MPRVPRVDDGSKAVPAHVVLKNTHTIGAAEGSMDMDLVEAVTAWLIGLAIGAALAQKNSRGFLVLGFGLPTATAAGLALAGKMNVVPMWQTLVKQVGALLDSGLWLPGLIGLALGVGLNEVAAQHGLSPVRLAERFSTIGRTAVK